ncbi:MAG: hypothetical protein Q8943_19750, partial [Bacteroidota bacterium]|nr:hypothetical protein [Bacteroidota bacterium]
MVILMLAAILAARTALTAGSQALEDDMLSCIIDPGKQDIRLYWKDDSGKILKNIQGLKTFLEHSQKKLVFAMNGGMFKADRSPRGLLIERGSVLAPLDTSEGEGNFYLKPNGVLYLTTERKARICVTGDFIYN